MECGSRIIVFAHPWFNPFRTAVPFWGQTPQISSRLPPKRDSGSKGVHVKNKHHRFYSFRQKIRLTSAPLVHAVGASAATKFAASYILANSESIDMMNRWSNEFVRKRSFTTYRTLTCRANLYCAGPVWLLFFPELNRKLDIPRHVVLCQLFIDQGFGPSSICARRAHTRSPLYSQGARVVA